MAKERGSAAALVDLGAALLAGALWYVRPDLGPLPLLLAIGFVVRHFSDPPVEYELTALDTAVALFLVSAGIGLLIAYDWNVALEKFYVILGGVGIYGAVVRVPGEIELAGRTVRPINLLLGVLPTAIAAYFVATADYSLQIGKLPFLDGVFEWISSWQPGLPGHKLHPNVAGGLIAALLPLQVLALAELAGAEAAMAGTQARREANAPDVLRLRADAVRSGYPETGRSQAGGAQAGRSETGQAQGSPLRAGGLEGGGAGAGRGMPPLPARGQANGAPRADRPANGARRADPPPYRLGWRGPGIETVLVVISVLGLVLSASRGAWAALVLVTAVWVLVSRVWPSRVGPAGGKAAAGVMGLVIVLVMVAAPVAVGASFDDAPTGRLALLRSSAQDAPAHYAQDASAQGAQDAFVNGRPDGQDAYQVGSTLSGTELAGAVQSKGAVGAAFGDAPVGRLALPRSSASFDYAPSGRSAQDASAQGAQDAFVNGRPDGQDAYQVGSTLSGTEPAGAVQSKGAVGAVEAAFDDAPTGRLALLRGSAQDAEPLRGLGAAPSAALLRSSAQDASAQGALAMLQGDRGGRPDGQDGEPLHGAELVDGRADLLRNSLDLAWDTAFTGIGLGGFQMAFSSYILLLHVGHTVHSHNLFVNVWLEQGLLGLVALVWLLGAAVVAWRRVRQLGDRQGKAWAAAALAAIAVIVVHGMVDDAFYGSRAVLLLFVPFGLLTRAQGDAVWAAYEPPTLTQVLMSRNGFIAAAVLAFALLIGLTPPVRSQFQANLGALSQTQAELSVYEWPTWPIQDALRRAQANGGAANEPGATTNGTGTAIDLGPATGHYQAALAIDPYNEVASRRLGQIELSRGNYPAAGELLTTAYYNDYTNRAARQLYGEWLAIEGRTEEARRVWRTVDVSAGQLDGRVWWYENIGEPDKAEAVRAARR